MDNSVYQARWLLAPVVILVFSVFSFGVAFASPRMPPGVGGGESLWSSTVAPSTGTSPPTMRSCG